MTIAYHGTHNANVQFNNERPLTNYNTIGTWFTSTPQHATMYGPHIIKAELTLNNPLIAHTDNFDEFFACLPLLDKHLGKRNLTEKEMTGILLNASYMGEWKEMLVRAGYDGIIFEDSRIDCSEGEEVHTVYIVFDANNIKILPTIYKCLSDDFPKLEQRINRITRKLDKHAKQWSFNIIGTEPKKIAVIDYRGRYDIPAWQFKPKTSYIISDVTSYTFEMEPLKLGQFEVLAVLEHNMVSIDGSTSINMIHQLQPDTAIPDKYRTVVGYCEHCKHNRLRNKTVLLQAADGTIKQVGTTCLQEYTGIDCSDVVSIYADIRAITIEDVSIDFDSIGKYDGKYKRTTDYLASSINRIQMDGYKKDKTKLIAWDDISKENYTHCLDTAKTVITYFKNKDFSERENFLNNIKVALTNEYTKQSGFIAYAYLAYQKEREKEKELEAKGISEYVGNVSDKLTIQLTITAEHTFKYAYSAYSDVTQRIYLFTDNNGNIFKWSTSKKLWKDEQNYIPFEVGDTITIKGTIKAHKEYQSIKQTELTRCKIVC